MKDFVDRLSADLSGRYVHYLETLLVDLWSEAGFIEFKCGFALRSDHLMRCFQIKVPALAGDTDGERRLIVVMIFEEIEEKIDLAIAENKLDAN
ncbi:hypothetical protein ABIB57_005254 [Devosia sp. UYZn731]|uniref:hypothetical protein n=1 Tax=Devosia sp. UYZn731 TaxID=3156345 RepID=UPI003396142C